MENYYIHKLKETDDVIIEKYKKAVLSNSMYESFMNEEQISLSKGYMVYLFIEGTIRNLEYLIITKGKEKTGVIDTRYQMASKEFIIHELKTKEFIEEKLDLDEIMIFNKDIIKKQETFFIEGAIEKTKEAICKRHNFILTNKDNWIDVAPIKEFAELKKRFYLEEIVYFDYFERGHRKTYRSLYSSFKEDFYFIDYIKSNQFNDFLKRFKNPIVHIPKDFLSQYYKIAFQVFTNTQEELKYIPVSKLLEKVKKNVEFKTYTKHDDYLSKLIFYFKKRNYLSYYTMPCKTLKEKIFYFYLTLKYNPESGYLLAEFVKNKIIEDDYIKLLSFSEKLGNTQAKKALFEYYSHPKTYNEVRIKRYTKQKEV
ncbi:MAG: hypothetical protein K2I42_05865 [Anaeroplasmataceae bacterium]|nr:hypothetical protein [Anaeroplasmataceae bacterium]